MRAVPEALRARLNTGVTTLATAWRVTRVDGAVAGFTDHDRDLVLDGVTYAGRSGLSGGDTVKSIGLDADDADIAGVLSSEGIAEADLLAGQWDGARVDVWRVDWSDPAADGGWEIVQARTITLVDVDTWELRDLLRGQQGTETALAAPVGARIVRLDGALARLDTHAHERGATLAVLAPPAGYPLSDLRTAETSAVFADVWARPFAPAQVRGFRDGAGDVWIGWVRRARLGGDAWTGEVPLGEEAESYRIEIRDGGVVVRVIETAAPSAVYAAADQVADFGAPPATLAVTVAQVSARYGPGRGRDSILQL